MSNKRGKEHIKAQKDGKNQDDFMCFFCLKVFNKNHGHHIIFFSEDGNPSKDNIITLCPECHRNYHNRKLNIEIGRF